MSSINFPDPRTYEFPDWVEIGDWLYRSTDVVAFGVPLTRGNVATAYRQGIFPWHIDGMPLPWYCPERRAILEFPELTIPRSLAKEKRKNKFTFTIDHDFRGVIENCSRVKRPTQSGATWITRDFVRVYWELHESGMAHSVETWDASGELVGGLYGVDAGGVFCGESMFYEQPNASKLALLFLIDHMRSRGATWLDVQVMTPHMEALGAKEIARSAFLDNLERVQRSGIKIF
ncbi:MAG TPA: leucyl/phenylalanyl-tRNA--protein transferase [Pyrinomonadaceae bacterium]|nr:leucyl/phenylalanyl-tRNA--protein transferase [Pyrinomonadaceae bacterium]